MIQHLDCATELGVNWVSVNLLSKYYMGINTQNDCSDAFRHTLFNSLNAALCGDINLAREFGEAHECETSSQKAKEMDLYNNEVGYAIIEGDPDISNLMNSGYQHLYHQGLSRLISSICNSLTSGDMKVFTDPSGLDPDNDPNNILISSNNCQCIN